MKISTKGRYGLRVLLDVALHEDDGVVSLRDISRRQAISQKYLWQVVTPLKAAGLLRAVRGTQGGYALARAPADSSLHDIVKILEGADSIVDCVGSPDACERSVDCVARGAWLQIEEQLDSALKAVTLKSLVEKQRDFESRCSPTYMI